ncbi:MAG TPA: SpoIIE family protein phosphatase [Vicinamibacterales bacterium]|nr:SpoIIE family protein phosphatase [Vicinamibacterales bacterium]
MASESLRTLPSAQGSPPRGAVPLLRTLPGRAIVAGVAAKVIIAALRLAGGGESTVLGVLDIAAGLAIAAGAVYFLARLFMLAKRRLLWRVRRKLILSYILIGVVPAVLIATFFVLGALLLFFNFSSYLVQTEVRSLGDRVRLLATSAALEIQREGETGMSGVLARSLRAAEADLPGVSGAVVSAVRACDAVQAAPPSDRSSTAASTLKSAVVRTGPWAHVDPPASVPDWMACDGYAGLIAYAPADRADAAGMLVRAVVFPESSKPRFGVVVDLPLEGDIRARLRRDIGVDLLGATFVDMGNARPLEGRMAAVPVTDRPETDPSGPLTWVTFLDYRDWDSGASGTLLVSTRLNVQVIYARISAAQGVVGRRPFGQALLLVLLVVVGGLFLVIEGVALVVGFALARSITGSVHELFAGTERVRQGDFSHKIGITARDQLGELAVSFNSMTASIEDLLRQAAEKKRLEEELRIAHEIQMSLLPQGPLVMPGLSATAVCIPAREVGGDYYDFLPLDDHRVGILIADVSGKGTSAALYMAQLKGLVLSLSTIHSSPRALLIAANRIIARHLDATSFITAAYAVVDVRQRTMTYARAGHTPLLHVSRGPDRRAKVLAPNGMIVGLKIDDGEIFEQLLEEQEIPLAAGDVFAFFTDGISEAMNEADDCFGEVRLARMLEDHSDLPSDELRERILREVRAFVNGAPQHDDMTMVLLKIEDLPNPAKGAEQAELAGKVD